MKIWLVLEYDYHDLNQIKPFASNEKAEKYIKQRKIDIVSLNGLSWIVEEHEVL